MKRQPTLFLLIFLLAGCQGVPSTSVPDQESFDLEKALKETGGNVTLKGVFYQSLKSKENDEIIDESSDEVLFEFAVDPTMSRHKKITSQSGEIVEEDYHSMGKDGYTYEPVMDYTGKETLVESLSEEGYSINYLNNYRNPFSMLSSSNLTKVDGEDKFQIDGNVSNYIFGEISGSSHVVSEAFVSYKDDSFSGAEFSIVPFEGEMEIEGETTEVVLHEELSISFENIGSTEIKVLGGDRATNDDLTSAFSSMGSNFTLEMTRHVDSYESEDYTSVFYFTGEEAYFKYRLEEEGRTNDTYFKKTSDGNVASCKYDKDSQSWVKKGNDEALVSLLPKFGEIDTSLFNGSSSGKYASLPIATASIALALCPKDYQGYSNFEGGSGDSVVVTLKDGYVDNYVMHSQYEVYSQLFSYTYTFKISDVGTTKLPSLS